MQLIYRETRIVMILFQGHSIRNRSESATDGGNGSETQHPTIIYFYRKEKEMPKKDDIYKCDVCGNVVLVLEGRDGDLVCCGENMRKLNEEEMKPYNPTLSKPGSP